MTDQHLLDILLQGKEAWEAWRIQQPVTLINLSSANLSHTDLSYSYLDNANLNEANLRDADLSYVHLNNAKLYQADLQSTRLNGGFLTRADLSSAHLENADLSYAFLNEANLSFAHLEEANLSHVYFSSSFLNDAHLEKADLSDSNLSYAHITRANLKQANLSHAELRYAILNGACLQEANLRDADLRDVSLQQVDLSHADLRGAHLDGAILHEVCLKGADLRGAHLNHTQLSHTLLTDADLTDAIVGWTLFANLDLRFVKGLKQLYHEGPSTIGADIVEQARGSLPDAFLRGAGLSDSFIAYTHSLIQPPHLSSPCFLYYAASDLSFTQRLHNDLQHKGIRCWLTLEPPEIGGTFFKRIEEIIDRYDQIVLILSQNALEHSWLEDVARVALEKEERFQKGQAGRMILFPITLDTSLKQAQARWIINLQQNRDIIDFSHWTDQASYDRAFQHLLHQLQKKPSI